MRESGSGNEKKDGLQQKVQVWSSRLNRKNFEEIHHAMKVRDDSELWKVLGVTEWSVVILQDHLDQFDCKLRSSREFNRMDRWSAVDFVKQVVEQVGRKGAFTVPYMCAKCNLMPKDDFMYHMVHLELGERGNGGRRRATCSGCAVESIGAQGPSQENGVRQSGRRLRDP